MDIIFRTIEKDDNAQLAELIKSVLREFKFDRPGTVYTDPQTNNLYELFATFKSIYWIAEEKGIILGGCGIYPTDGLPEGCVELVKLYLSSPSRGKGIGKALLQKCILSAKELGYNQLYLESFPELAKAVGLYENAGFRKIDAPLGNSVHFACTLWMVKDISEFAI